MTAVRVVSPPRCGYVTTRIGAGAQYSDIRSMRGVKKDILGLMSQFVQV